MKRGTIFTIVLTFVVISLLLLSAACGLDSSGTRPVRIAVPVISGELVSFDSTSIASATVYVMDGVTGESIPSALVIINGSSLAYDTTERKYQGAPAIVPGENVTLTVNVHDISYTLETTQFASYPAIASPKPQALWSNGYANEVLWSSALAMTRPSMASVYSIRPPVSLSGPGTATLNPSLGPKRPIRSPGTA